MHYFKVCSKIISSTYSYENISLLFCYFRLVIKSYFFHNFTTKKNKSASTPLTEKVMGFTVHFFQYPQLINLFEEIFIYQIYKFASAKSDPEIIDCGSNIGISILYFKKVFPTCIIKAFEPDSATFSMLEKNIRENNLSNVSLFNYALSDIEQETSLYKNNIQGSLGMSLLKSTELTRNVSIRTKKLSDFINNHVDFIKIDTEGSEVKIIHELISSKKISFIQKMVIEFHRVQTKLSVEDFMDTIRDSNFLCSCKADRLHEGATEVMVHCLNGDFQE